MHKDSKRVELKIEVDNKAESHRLRIMFPTNLNVTAHYGEGQFDVVKRSAERPDTKDWVEQPMYDFPLHQFADVSDNKNGLAILVNGLKEYELLNDNAKTLALTLFRSFEFIIAPSSRQDYTHLKGSQCLGKSTYELAIYPHKGDWIEGKVYEEALNYNNHITLVQSGKSKGNLPNQLSFMKITPGALQFSALKKPEDGAKNCYVLRIYNPTEKEINGKVEFYKPIKKVDRITLEEVSIEPMALMGESGFKVSIKKKKIGTYKILFK